MVSHDITPVPLTRQSFAPFGDVIEVHEENKVMPINYGLADRHHDLAHLDTTDEGGRAIVSIFRTQPIVLPFTVKIMERHPLGSQTFMPLSGNPYLVLVAPAGEFDPAALQAFWANSNQGVNYHKGIWHHYCLGLNDSNDFLVIDRGGRGDNCDEISIAEDLTVTLKV